MNKIEDVINEIRQASKYDYPLKISIIDKLLSEKKCEEEDLVLAFRHLHSADEDRVIVFFQLPFILQLPEKWVHMQFEYGHPIIQFRRKNLRKYKEYLWQNNTQVIVSYQLWSRNVKLYPLYLASLKSGQKPVKTDLRSTGELRVGEFESVIVRELYSLTLQVLERFISVYRVTCKDPYAFSTATLHNFFMMVKTGRVVMGPISKDKMKINTKLDENNERERYEKNLENLTEPLKLKNLPNIYEGYLVETSRLLDLKQNNLVVVQTIMILDWFANEIIENHLFSALKKSLLNKPKLYQIAFGRMWENSKDDQIRVSTKAKFFRYMPAIGINLPNELVKGLKIINDKRDAIIHREHVNLVDHSFAKETLEIGHKIISHCMNSLLKDSK